MTRELAITSSEPDKPVGVIAKSAAAVKDASRVVRFRNRPMILMEDTYPHYIPLTRERFDSVAYPLLGGVSRGKMGDVFSYLSNTVEDLSMNEDLIGFGYFKDDDDEPEDQPSVSNMVDGEHQHIPFILSLAGGDEGVYDDIMQSLAPLVMKRKPDGVIWWIGDGANGKSTLMDAIYRIFPGQLSSITVKRLVDGRDTPSLNGTLANIVKESSEGRVEDTEIYKSIGTHENFRVHKFHSQDDTEIRGNIHHIFSANTIPSFNDKGFSARRRTFIIPFTERFESDTGFEERTFTPEFFGQLVVEMCSYANRLKRQGYRYKWSGQTLAAKLEYDTEANNAEEYAKTLIDDGCIAFTNFTAVRTDYDNWCSDQGYVPLGVNNLRKAIAGFGFYRSTKRDDDGNPESFYRLTDMKQIEFQQLAAYRLGLFTAPGFGREPTNENETPDPPENISILGDKW
jgi:hypothetical protein